MKFSVASFRAWENRSVTLLGMSGVGKTYLSSLLREHNWFHYSGDYRIGTRYLDEPILDMIKSKAMAVPFLGDLLRNDWIYIRNNIKVSDLGPVLAFVGKLGDPERGGVELEVTQLGKECHTPCAIYHQVGMCIMPTTGIFCRVLAGGPLAPGDAIEGPA